MKKSNLHKQSELSIEKVKKELAKQIGVEVEDINLEDRFLDDLHMNATDLTDFIENLSSKGFDTKKLDFSNLESLNNLLEQLEVDELG